MKSYIALHMRRIVFPRTDISLADRLDLSDRDNFCPIAYMNTTFLQNLCHSEKL